MSFTGSQTVRICNALFLLALMAIVGAVGFIVTRRPSPATSINSRSIDLACDRSDAAADAATQAILGKEWNLDSEELGGAVLSHLSVAAEKYRVQISDFRADKAVVVGEQRLTPFLVEVDGDFQNVMKLVASLEDPGSKLGVRMLQVAAGDKTPGEAKATLGLVAFMGGPA